VASDYYPAAVHPRLSPDEREEIAEVLRRGRMGIGELARAVPFSSGVGLVFAKFLSDAAWYFYLFWLPKYLYDVRHSTPSRWLLCLDSLCGSRNRRSVRRLVFQPAGAVGPVSELFAKLALGLSAAVMPLIFFVTRAPVEIAIVLFSIAFAGQQSWSTLVMILPAGHLPAPRGGLGGGIGGLRRSDGRRGFRLGCGLPVGSRLRYGVVFGVVSTFHVLAFCVILATVRVVRPIEAKA